MHKKDSSVLKDLCAVLLGALLMGFLWRVRGTNGWGSSWGLLNAGFVFYLFLNVAVDKKTYVSLPLMGLSALSFMLTCPAWGTYLTQITGLLSAAPKEEETVLYEISPLSGVIMMLCLGFGLASVYGILLGRGFGKKAWRVRDYAAVLSVFIVTDLLAKASVSHLLLRLIEPQAVTAFTDGLRAAGMSESAYQAYMAHFSAVSWAKKLIGGRNYFSSVGTLSLVVAGVASLLTARFFVKDRYAAKTGAVVCGAFAFSITVSDLFFFFGNGGYHMEQGFSLPDSFAPWSLWEYFTGFIAGGIITAWLLKTARANESAETVLLQLPEKPRNALAFLLAAVAGVGLNVVRPVLVRVQNLNETAGIVAAAVLGVLLLVLSLLFAKKCGFLLPDPVTRRLVPGLCAFFVLYIFVVYVFVGRPEIGSISMAHNLLVTVSAAALLLCLIPCFCRRTGRRS